MDFKFANQYCKKVADNVKIVLAFMKYLCYSRKAENALRITRAYFGEGARAVWFLREEGTRKKKTEWRKKK